MSSTDSPRKHIKRRTRTRNISRDCVINMAGVRRQIARALHLHRNRTLLSATSVTDAEAEPSCCSYNREDEKAALFSSSSQSQHLCYSILASMPLPQPIWSTTGPSVMGSPAMAVEEVEGFEWGDGDGDGQGSYAWWLGFLKSMDVKKSNSSDAENSGSAVGMGMMSSMVLGQCRQNGSEGAAETDREEDGSLTDEWLIIPINEDEQLI